MSTFVTISGNTITFRLSVRDEDLVLTNLDSDAGTLVIYDKNYESIYTTTLITKISTGIYEFEYTTIKNAINPTKYYYEISGKVNGEDIVERDFFETDFV